MSERIERQLRERGPDGMVLPAYEDYCFTNVPGIVGEAFGVDIGRSLPTGTEILPGLTTSSLSSLMG